MAFDKEKTLAAAQKYADKDQHEKAIREFQKILDVEPNDLRVLLLIASSYERVGKMDEASNAYVKIFEQYRNQGAYQKALAIIKQAQHCNPNSDDIAMSMAEIYSALGLPHEAVNQLEKCLANAEKSQNHRTYARILQTMVRVDGENVQTRIRYAQMLQRDGDTDDAKRQYSLALAQLLSKEKYIDYIQTSREYLRIAPKDAEVLQALAGIYIRMNRFNDAITMLSVLPSNERTPEIREHFITCYTKTGRTQDAVRELKDLAKQYIANDEREDLIESVWLRAQKMAPNDPEIIAALDDSEIPMLSDSALSLVDENGIPSRVYTDEAFQEAAQAAQAPQMSALDRMLQSKYDEALFYYNRGNADAAQKLCLQIVAGNEQHLPALRLLAQILEQNGDLVMLAQIERKIARALFETDIDEAVRHVLRAEQCTPRAWENFNLMLVFGLDPAQYGMQAPESSGVSNPRIPVAQLNAAVNSQPPFQAPPPLPRRAPSVNMSPEQFAQGTPALSQPNAVPVAVAGAQRTHASSGAFSSIQQPPQRPNSGAFSSIQQPPQRPNSGAFSSIQQPPQRPNSGAFSGIQQPPQRPNSGVFNGMPQRSHADSGSYAQPRSAATPSVPQPAIPSRPATPSVPPKPHANAQGNPHNSISQIGRTLSNDLDNAFDGIFGDAGSEPQEAHSPSATIAEPLPAWMRRSQATPGAPAHVPSRQSTRATIAAPSTAFETASLMGSVSNTPNNAFGSSPSQRSIDPMHNHAITARSNGANAAGFSSGAHRRQTGNLPTTVIESPALAQLSPPSAQLSHITRQPSGQIPAIPRQPSAQIPVAQTQAPVGIPRQPSAQIPVAQPRAPVGIPRQPSAQIPVAQTQIPVVQQQAPAGIPPQDRKTVEESIQEINFYASLMLVDDARNLLNALIQKYGDVDIIHDAKLRIDAL